jgi:NDP-sugar pyrophosphorylase family protein
MQAVILAGGLGKRLRPFTEAIPKPMVPVAGVPYLAHQLKLLKRQSITDVILCTGYLGEQIESYFGGGDNLGMSIRYSWEPRLLGTGGALRLAEPLLAQEFLILYGDSYLPMDYHLPWAALIGSTATGVVVLYKDVAGETGVQANIATDAAGLIRCYDKDSTDRQDLVYIEAGVLAFRRQVLQLIPPGTEASLEKDVFPKLIERGELAGLVTDQRFYDIGTPERLHRLEEFFRDHN